MILLKLSEPFIVKRFMLTDTYAEHNKKKKDKQAEIQAVDNSQKIDQPARSLEDNVAFFQAEGFAGSSSSSSSSATTNKSTNNMDDGNTTCEPSQPAKEIYSTLGTSLEKEAMLADIAVKTISANIEEIGNKLGKEIEKSKELAEEHKKHIANLDSYIKSIKTLPWKKALSYSATIITVGYIIYKMGLLRKIPDFMSNLIAITPPSSIGTLSQSTELPKPSLNTSLHTIMETPLTPITILTAVGGFSIALGILKITLWVLRKSPK